jgi:hypothetical protein
MTIIRKGFYVELVNESTSRVVFAAATDQIDLPTFEQLWQTIWRGVFAGLDERGKTNNQAAHYRLRVSPIQGDS